MKKMMAIVASILLMSLLLSPVALGRISLSGGIGLHVFDLKESDDEYVSYGSFAVTNHESVPVNISLTVMTELLSTDLNDEQFPRVHDIYRGNITFYRFPKDSWILLNESSYFIPSGQSRVFNYTVCIPFDQLPDDQHDKQGYLGYIKVEGEGDGSVGVNYLHKVFVCFNGQLAGFDVFFWGVVMGIIIVIGFIVIISLFYFMGVRRKYNAGW